MTNEPRAGGGIDPELLAAYIDKRLPPDERAAVEAQLATDPDSYELLVELIHADEALNPADAEPAKAPEDRPEEKATVVPLVPKPARTRTWAIAGGVMAVAAALVLMVRLQPELWQRYQGNSTEPQLAALVAAAADLRITEGRLTGGFAFAPAPVVTRGTGAEPGLNVALLKAAGDIQMMARREASAANLHAEGVAQLLIGNRDGAIQALESAAGLAPDRAAVWSDLAAAYLARGDAEGDPSDYSRALEAVTKAVANQERPSAETLYNRALVAEKLNSADVRRFWEAALAAESDPSWKAEIAGRIRQEPAR